MNTFPNYIINRSPLKFGGQQEDFQNRHRSLVQWGARQIKETPKEESALVLLYFRLIEEFSKQRQVIAKDHKTPKAEKFGCRRDKEGKAEFYNTILDQEYSEYNVKFLTFLAEHMRDMKLDKKEMDLVKKEPVKKSKILEETCLDHFSSFEIEILETEELAKRDWLKNPTPNDLPVDFPIELLRKDRETFSPKDLHIMKQALKKLKINNVELYKRLKMNMNIIELNKEYPSPQKIPLDNKGTCNFIGKEGNLKSFFVLGTARLGVKGKNYATTQYFTWLYRDFKTNPVDRMLRDSTVILIHQDNFLIDDTLQEIALIFAKAVLSKKENLIELKNNTGLIRHYMAHDMAWERGSSTIGELVEGSVYGSFDLEVKYYPEKQIDLEALATPLLSRFLKDYDNMIELKSTQAFTEKVEGGVSYKING